MLMAGSHRGLPPGWGLSWRVGVLVDVCDSTAARFGYFGMLLSF